jgi:ferric-dicitrate binding protein FerR (iron transport regulator)
VRAIFSVPITTKLKRPSYDFPLQKRPDRRRLRKSRLANIRNDITEFLLCTRLGRIPTLVGKPDKARSLMDSSRSIHRWLLQGVAVVLCLVATMSLRSAADTQAPMCSTPIDRYTSGVGDRIFATLPDGSLLALNSNTNIVATCSRTGRLVRLLKGEAQIFVKHERAPRPFILWTNQAAVQDVGTGFNVRAKENSTEIAVTDGTVRVYPHAAALRQSSNAPLAVDGVGVELHKGARASVDSATCQLRTLPALDNDGLRRLLAWRTGNIDLYEVSLAEAIDEFNRYSPRRYRVVHIPPEYAKHPLSGYFDDGGIDDFLAAAETELHIEFHRSVDAEGNILLTIRANTPPGAH